ncbi:phosphotriesterase family protein [Clavibacter michiganensis]|uniref:phosphotriesterase family protein n=1 Tax=Clavibacter michiganensis TaxID=28447 RepID=UPI0029302996|nr:hypothetical protein [Clavibacter michiganensis]
MSGRIRTLLGDVEPDGLGAVDAHDHLFLSSPALPGEGLDDADAAERELRAFRRVGGGTVVQWTPRGLGRSLTELALISSRTGVHVVAATGRHRAALYARGSSTTALSGDGLADAFVRDVRDRRCGLVKVGVAVVSGSIPVDERDALDAAAAAHRATGVPVAVHLEGGGGARPVLSRLAAGGVAASSVVLGHLGRNPDDCAVLDAAGWGAWVCLDAPSPRHPDPHDRLPRLLAALAADGRMGRVLLGADTTTASARAEPHGCGPAALLTSVVPPLHDRVGGAAMRAVLRDNPGRAWAVATVVP